MTDKRKIFIDCGANMGMGFSEIASRIGVDHTWEVFGFEPNEYAFDGYVENIKSERFPSLNNKNITLIQKVVWIEDGSIEFCMEGLSESHYNENPEWKKAIDEHNLKYSRGEKVDYTKFGVPSLGGSCVKDMHEKLDRPIDHEIKFEWSSPVSVESIDFSQWIKDNFSKEDYIFLKMDIEGSEYKVLPKMIDDGTITYIDSLVIEWHDCVLPDFKMETVQLKNQLQSLGINVTPWG